MANNLRLNHGPKRRTDSRGRTLWVTIEYREYGRTRMEIPVGIYRRAQERHVRTDKLLPEGDGCRKKIAKDVRDEFNKHGLTSQFIYWTELKFSEVSYQPGHPEDGKTIIYQFFVNTFDDEVRAVLDYLPPATEAEALQNATELFPETFGRQTEFESTSDEDDDSRYPCGCTGSLPPVTTK